MIVAIVDIIDAKEQGKVFKLVASNKNQDGTYDYRRVQKTEQNLAADLSIGKYKLINGALDLNKIKAIAGDFNRFNNGVQKPLVIVAELVDHRAITLGYKVANCNGDVASMALKSILEYCEEMTVKGGIPIQNGIYVPAKEGQRAFIRCYPNAVYSKEIHARKTSQHVKPVYIDKRQGEKNVSKLEEMFNKEQIKQLQLGKKNGMDIRIIGNNKLSAEQMEVIRICEENGLHGRQFADPAYGLELMHFFQAELFSGGDIRAILNPRYNVGQALEISIANELGLDTSDMDDPSIDTKEMYERRIRLANGMWKKHDVETDTSWK